MTIYIPSYFRNHDRARIDAVIRNHPFATLISATQAGLFISHVPILAQGSPDGDMCLHFHLARANPHAGELIAGADTTAVFSGPHAYISPTWYESRDNVPTWNYAAVHLTGRPVPAQADETLDDLARLAAEFESGPQAWRPAELSPAKQSNLLRALQAFRMPVKQVEAKEKLSQNRPEADRLAILRGLENSSDPDAPALRRLMETL